MTDTARGAAAGAQGGVSQTLASALREVGPLAAGYGLPFLLVLYLGLKGGGYDLVVRSEVGIAVWWIVLLGALIGVLPRARVGTAGWVGLGLLAAFAAWTALGVSWSESSERSVAELGRVVAYAGVFTLALCAQGRDGLRRMVGALGAAVGILGALALLSRLHPSWFPANETAEALPSAAARLSYPLNYWNGVAALAAIGVPLLLGMATTARSIAAQALSAAAVPVLALTAFYTLSRGGAVELAAAVIVLLVLFPRRLALLAGLIPAAAGATILVAAATQRDALEDNLGSAAAQSQGDEMLAMVVVVCAGVGLVQAAISLARRHELGPRVRISRRGAALGAVTAGVVAIVIAVAAGLPGQLSDGWEEFKQPIGPESNTTAERFESASGNGRYQYWQSALDANATEPLVGTGPGTFEYWWAREGTLPGFIRDAHSLYFETLGELGIIGLLLVGGLILYVLGAGVARSVRAGSTERRALVATATAACVAFAVAAGVDWAWELAVLPVIFLLLAAAILGPSAESRDRREVFRVAGRAPMPVRAGLLTVAVLGLVAIAIPMTGTDSVRDSQGAVRAQQLGPALEEARAAASIQPYAATPGVQEALVLELAGDLNAAAVAAREATDNEPTNWRTWLVLSRIEAERGEAGTSVAAYREARELNPRSPLFQR